MKAIITLFCLFLLSNAYSQKNKLSVIISKDSSRFYTVNEQGKHVLDFVLNGITDNNEADNILKVLKNYRGVESFSLEKMSNNSSFHAHGVLYKYAVEDYYKFFFKKINVTELIINGEKVQIDNL